MDSWSQLAAFRPKRRLYSMSKIWCWKIDVRSMKPVCRVYRRLAGLALPSRLRSLWEAWKKYKPFFLCQNLAETLTAHVTARWWWKIGVKIYEAITAFETCCMMSQTTKSSSARLSIVGAGSPKLQPRRLRQSENLQDSVYKIWIIFWCSFW